MCVYEFLHTNSKQEKGDKDMTLTCSDLYFRKEKPDTFEKKLSKKSLFEFIRYVSCGFELECQTFHGKTTSDFNRQINESRQINIDAYQRALTESYERLLDYPLSHPELFRTVRHMLSNSMTIAFIKNKYPRQYPDLKVNGLSSFRLIQLFEIRGTKLKDVMGYLNSSEVNTTRRNKGNELSRTLMRGIRGLNESFITGTDLCVDENNFAYGDPTFHDMKKYFEYHAERDLPRNVELVPDGSVSGPEIRTIGGLKPVEFLRTAKEVLKRNIKVNAGCSFHIHIALNKTDESRLTGTRTHVPSAEVQHYAFEYILRHVHEFPLAVRERISQNQRDGRKYYKFDPSRKGDRYFCIAQRHDTYEFRMWGNIADYKSVSQCLMMTIKALHYGLRVVNGQDKPVFNNLRDLEFNRELRDIISYYLDSEAFRVNQCPFEVFIRKRLPSGSLKREETRLDGIGVNTSFTITSASADIREAAFTNSGNSIIINPSAEGSTATIYYTQDETTFPTININPDGSPCHYPVAS